jgi:phosphate/sulfate permease
MLIITTVFVANLVTAGLVIGAVTRQGHWGVIGQIAGAWVITLPLAGVLGAFIATLLH